MPVLWDAVLQPLLTALSAKVIVEIGVGGGTWTPLLLRWCVDHGGVLHLFDPVPGSAEDEADRQRWSHSLVIHEMPDTLPLAKLPVHDAAIIDGRRDSETVIGAVEAVTSTDDPPLVVILRSGRRHDARGLVADLEDVVSGHPSGFRVTVVPVLGGLTLLVPDRRSAIPKLETFLQRLELTPEVLQLVDAVEVERDVLERLGDEATRTVERLSARVGELEQQIVVLGQERASLARERQSLRAQVRSAREQYERLLRRRIVRLGLALAGVFAPVVAAGRRWRTRRRAVPNTSSRPHAKPVVVAAPSRQDVGALSADIIVCVHNAPDDVRACLESLEANTNLVRHRLIIVDDGSESETRQLLRTFAARTNTTLLRHDVSRGYTRAANRGLATGTNPYAVLLNSDTIVPSGWLERMLACAATRPDAAVVGPLSNAASWQSIPVLTEPDGSWHVNELPPGTTVDEYAGRLAKRSTTIYPEVALINGFCYLIAREALERVGPLDEESFPRGYGEEDDFSIRSLDAGFRNYVADDCYVFHAKSRTFTPEVRSEIVEVSKRRLQDKHGATRIKSLVRAVRFADDLVRARTHASLSVAGPRVVDPPELGGRRPVLGWLQPHLERVGGIRRAIEMTNRLTAWGFEVHLVTPGGESTDWLPILSNVTSVRAAREVVFDVLINSDPDMITDFQAFTAKRRIVYHLAPYMLYRLPDAHLNSFYDIEDGSVHIANSGWTAQQVGVYVGDDVVEHVLPGAVDHAMFRPVRAQRSWDVVCSGSQREHKGTGAVEEAAAGYRLLKLEELDAPQHELAYHLASARVFASAAWHEGFNFLPLEAMACGVPVVMTDDGGSREYARDGENAVVVPVGDVDAMRDGIRQVLDDAELRARLIESGMRTAWEYDWNAVTLRLAHLVLNL